MAPGALIWDRISPWPSAGMSPLYCTVPDRGVLGPEPHNPGVTGERRCAEKLTCNTVKFPALDYDMKEIVHQERGRKDWMECGRIKGD